MKVVVAKGHMQCSVVPMVVVVDAEKVEVACRVASGSCSVCYPVL